MSRSPAAVVVLALTALSLPSGTMCAQSHVSVAVGVKGIGAAVPEEYVGLSFETESLLSGSNGKHLFSAQNKPLIAMFKTLGVRSLRVGGNTADRPTVRIPAYSDIDHLFAFAKAAAVKVIFTLRLRQGDPERAAEITKYIMDRYSSHVTCFAIGNEPNVFAGEYPAYRDEWKKYVEIITAPRNAPDAMFCGPSSTPGKSEWCKDFARDFGHSGRIRFISQHAYPGGSGKRVTNPASARDSMLSAGWVESYEDFYRAFVPGVQAIGLPYRLEETNNYFHGGAVKVSNSFAAALWGLDYMYWWASHGALGLNFHTGDSVAAAETTAPCRYASFTTSAAGYAVHPLGYAIKTFGLGSHGNIVPARISSNADNASLSAYATRSTDGSVCVTLINKETGAHQRDVDVTLVVDGSFVRGEKIFLTAPNGNLAATSGITLGGAEIKDDASWAGSWIRLEAPSKTVRYHILVPAASAAVVRLAVR